MLVFPCFSHWNNTYFCNVLDVTLSVFNLQPVWISVKAKRYRNAYLQHILRYFQRMYEIILTVVIQTINYENNIVISILLLYL